jgi:hypothetical protein
MFLLRTKEALPSIIRTAEQLLHSVEFTQLEYALACNSESYIPLQY